MTKQSFDTAPCGYISFFDDGAICEVNSTCCTWLGFTNQEILKKNIESLFTLPARIFYQTHFFPMVKMQGHAEEIFLLLLTNDKQQLPVLLNAKRTVYEEQPCISCSFMVVANRKKFEDELVAARKDAERALRENIDLLKAKAELQRHTELLDSQIQLAQKQNNELRQLNHVVTHSLREPLRKILINTEKLKLHSIDGETSADVDRILRASAQMNLVVEGLQQYIWLNDTPVHFSKVNLNDIVQQAKAKLKPEQSFIPLVLQTNPLPVIEADAQQLEAFFYQLFSNSLQFKREEMAYVNITASILQQNRFRNIEGKYRYEDFVKLEITDKGTGFESSAPAEVFELFKKAHASQAIGLGLALCKKIADNHSGSVSIHSKVNEGTTVLFTLPVVQTFEAATALQS